MSPPPLLAKKQTYRGAREANRLAYNLNNSYLPTIRENSSAMDQHASSCSSQAASEALRSGNDEQDDDPPTPTPIRRPKGDGKSLMGTHDKEQSSRQTVRNEAITSIVHNGAPKASTLNPASLAWVPPSKPVNEPTLAVNVSLPNRRTFVMLSLTPQRLTAMRRRALVLLTIVLSATRPPLCLP
jgi:hypothetical protein